LFGDVFVNCPFDDEYIETFRALVFTIRTCGFRPRSARELDDGGQARIEKLYGLIKECPYGIHDISRTEADSISFLPRFNMPFELGLFMGAKRYGDRRQRDKFALIFDSEKYRYQRFISDLAGMDIHAHGGEPDIALVETRHWLTNVSRRQLPGDRDVLDGYRRFQSELPSLADGFRLDSNKLTYIDFDFILTGWLESRAGAVESHHPLTPKSPPPQAGSPA